MGTIALFLIAAGGIVMSLLYPGEDFEGGRSILSILAISAAIASVGAPATIALSAAERGKAIAGLSLTSCVLGSIVVWMFLVRWGLTGAAIGILITDLLGTAARWALLLSGGRNPHMRKT
jgi:O-antigen/teichoic acid export membrane protein